MSEPGDATTQQGLDYVNSDEFIDVVLETAANLAGTTTRQAIDMIDGEALSTERIDEGPRQELADATATDDVIIDVRDEVRDASKAVRKAKTEPRASAPVRLQPEETAPVPVDVEGAEEAEEAEVVPEATEVADPVEVAADPDAVEAEDAEETEEAAEPVEPAQVEHATESAETVSPDDKQIAVARSQALARAARNRAKVATAVPKPPGGPESTAAAVPAATVVTPVVDYRRPEVAPVKRRRHLFRQLRHDLREFRIRRSGAAGPKRGLIARWRSARMRRQRQLRNEATRAALLGDAPAPAEPTVGGPSVASVALAVVAIAAILVVGLVVLL